MITLFKTVDKPLPLWLVITLLVICSIIWIVALITTIINRKKEPDEFEDDSLEPFAPLFVIIIPLIVGAITPIYIVKKNNYDEYYKAEYHEVMYENIYSVERSNETKGSFVLGSGTVSEKTYYYFYTKVSENTYKLEKIATKNCYIVETNETNYYISMDKLANSGDYHYNIVVPVGTIVQQFNG